MLFISPEKLKISEFLSSHNGYVEKCHMTHFKIFDVRNFLMLKLKLGAIDICKNVTFFATLNKFTLHYIEKPWK